MPLAAAWCQTDSPVQRKPLPSYLFGPKKFKSLSLDPSMGMELLRFVKSTGNTRHKNKVLQWPWRNCHHMKSCRMQPSAQGIHILPSLPAVILLTTLHDDATCLKSFSHLATCEMLSRVPWWLVQSGKFRNVSDFWAAWASTGSCLPIFLLFKPASVESISDAFTFL